MEEDRLFAYFDGPDLRRQADGLRRLAGGRLYGLHWRKSGLNQTTDFVSVIRMLPAAFIGAGDHANARRLWLPFKTFSSLK